MRVLVSAALIATAPLVAQTTPPSTVQQEFTAATELQDARKFAEALAAWETLEKRVTRNARSLAIVRVRKAAALMALDRLDEAGEAARAGLAGLPVTDATVREDRFTALMSLGRIAQGALDYASAAERYAEAEALAEDPVEKLRSLNALLHVQTFVDIEKAQTTLAKLQPIMDGKTISDTLRGILKSRASEYYLNRGDFTQARKIAGQAVEALGGLGYKITVADVAARSDYAIAAIRLGAGDDARKYLAYSGAGMTGAKDKDSFGAGADFDPPDCGGEDGLKPDDVAIVQFAVDDLGRVSESVPVYSSRDGAVALAFARAVLGWSWSIDAFKGVSPFFRQNVRVELRCSTAFSRPGVIDLLDDSLAAWLTTKGVATPTEAPGPIAAAYARDHAAIAQLAPNDATLKSVPVLAAVARNGVAPREESYGAAMRGLSLIEAADAPAPARLSFALRAAMNARDTKDYSTAYQRELSQMLERPIYAGDPVARGVLSLMIADGLRTKDRAKAKTVLQPVADDAALPANHPLRVGALMRIAAIDSAMGNRAGAQQAFAQTGLDEQQCALLDAPPAPIRFGGPDQFPMEAIRWGFEGWGRVQYDVDAEGRPHNARTIVSYPPFVFTDASTNVVNASRFTKAYRPGGSIGCGGLSNRIRFLMP